MVRDKHVKNFTHTDSRNQLTFQVNFAILNIEIALI